MVLKFLSKIKIFKRTESQLQPYKIDWDFIRELEGFSLQGYVPMKGSEVLGKSGVTIGCGFDLGQHGYYDLEVMNIPEKIRNKLNPYLMVRGTEALNLLKSLPLKLSLREVTVLDECVKALKAEFIEEEFNQDSKKEFKDLTKGQQTVIASIAFQYGHLKKRCPKFWLFATKQKWPELIHELENFGDAYKTRRIKEAKYLKGEMK